MAKKSTRFSNRKIYRNMWILQKKLIVDGLTEYAYFSETSDADVNRDLAAAKDFASKDLADKFRDEQGLKDWTAIKYNDPAATALEPWELEK